MDSPEPYACDQEEGGEVAMRFDEWLTERPAQKET
jgi:hypothetical protein